MHTSSIHPSFVPARVAPIARSLPHRSPDSTASSDSATALAFSPRTRPSRPHEDADDDAVGVDDVPDARSSRSAREERSRASPIEIHRSPSSPSSPSRRSSRVAWRHRALSRIVHAFTRARIISKKPRVFGRARIRSHSSTRRVSPRAPWAVFRKSVTPRPRSRDGGDRRPRGRIPRARIARSTVERRRSCRWSRGCRGRSVGSSR